MNKSRSTRGPLIPARAAAGGVTTTNLLGLAGIVGLVVLGNHGRQFDVLQSAYASRQDCLDDWGSEESCPAVPQSGSGHSWYFGPRYYWDPDRGKPVVVSADGSEHVATSARIGPGRSSAGRTSIVGSFARGGFGGIGRGFSSGHGG